MLVLSRQRDETIMIGDNIEITVVDIRGDKVRLGITAPTTVPVHRKEVYEAIQRENREAAKVRMEDLGTLPKPPSPPSPPSAPGAAGAGGSAGPPGGEAPKVRPGQPRPTMPVTRPPANKPGPGGTQQPGQQHPNGSRPQPGPGDKSPGEG